MSKFGITVEPTYSHKDRYWVWLPHSCDEWVISGDYERGVTKEEAIEDINAFIAELEAAKETLSNVDGSKQQETTDVQS